MEFDKDDVRLKIPSARSAGLVATLEGSLEGLEVGESGTVDGKLSSVRSLLCRYVARKRKHASEWSDPEYLKRFVAREVKERGKVRVWRVA